MTCGYTTKDIAWPDPSEEDVLEEMGFTDLEEMFEYLMKLEEEKYE